MKTPSNPRWRSIRDRWPTRVAASEDIHDVRNDPTMYRPGSVTQGVDKREHRRSAAMRTGDHALNWSTVVLPVEYVPRRK